MSTFTKGFLHATARIAASLDVEQIEGVVSGLYSLREREGRLFIVGVGGGAGHASHAAADFRKLCGIESYAPADNVSGLTAHANDYGWASTIADWLGGSRITHNDALLVFSVGGGSVDPPVSENIVVALNLARTVGANVYGIVGPNGGETAKVADACVIVPAPAGRVTPHVEGFQAVIWHLIVTHPSLAVAQGKWEQIEAR